MTPENKGKPLNKLYPEHTKALKHAKLPVPKIYPMLQESLEAICEREASLNNQTNESDLAEELQNNREIETAIYLHFLHRLQENLGTSTNAQTTQATS